MNPKKTECYECSTCGSLCRSEEIAAGCCRCAGCGLEIERNTGCCASCRSRRERDWLANKLTKATETDDYGPMLWCEQREEYYSEPNDVLGDYENETDAPDWLFGTTEMIKKLDIDAAIEAMLDDTYDDAEVDAASLAKLRVAVDEFNATAAIRYIVRDYSKKVRVPKATTASMEQYHYSE